MKIAILTPSRGRPGRLDNFICSVLEHAKYPDNILLYNYIDDDDPRLKSYEDFYRSQPINVYNVISTPQSVSKSWNVLANIAIGVGSDILIMGNDDQLYSTVDWDEVLVNEVSKYDDKIYCAWFNDLINGENHCAFPIVSSTWFNTLGYFTPGIFNFGFNDTWVFDLAKRIGRTHYIPSVIAEHRHFSVGKSSMDDTYHRNRTQERGNLFAKDQVVFDVTAGDREESANKLRAVMK